MPTLLPSRPLSEPRLSLHKTIRFLILVASVRFLDLRMHRVVRQGSGYSDDRLLRLMRRWLATHEAIAALLPGIPEPQHVREVRAILPGFARNPEEHPRPPFRWTLGGIAGRAWWSRGDPTS